MPRFSFENSTTMMLSEGSSAPTHMPTKNRKTISCVRFWLAARPNMQIEEVVVAARMMVRRPTLSACGATRMAPTSMPSAPALSTMPKAWGEMIPFTQQRRRGVGDRRGVEPVADVRQHAQRDDGDLPGTSKACPGRWIGPPDTDASAIRCSLLLLTADDISRSYIIAWETAAASVAGAESGRRGDRRRLPLSDNTLRNVINSIQNRNLRDLNSDALRIVRLPRHADPGKGARHVDDTVALDKVTKQYATHTAVDGLSLTVAGGEIYALLGPKQGQARRPRSTCRGLHCSDRGTLQVAGRNVADDPAAARRQHRLHPGTG